MPHLLNSLFTLGYMMRYPMSLCFIENPNPTGGGPGGAGNTPPADPPTGNEGGDNAPPAGSDGDGADGDDWQAKYEAQAKTVSNLEKKLKSALTKDDAEKLRAQIAKLEGKEAEYQKAQEAREAETAALTKANQRVVARAVREHAATQLADVTDALKMLDLTQFEVDEDGEVDDAAIKTAIAGLMKAKPYLAKKDANPFQSVTDGREGAASGKQLTMDDIDKMTPAQINEALKKGQLKNLGY